MCVCANLKAEDVPVRGTCGCTLDDVFASCSADFFEFPLGLVRGHPLDSIQYKFCTSSSTEFCWRAQSSALGLGHVNLPLQYTFCTASVTEDLGVFRDACRVTLRSGAVRRQDILSRPSEQRVHISRLALTCPAD